MKVFGRIHGKRVGAEPMCKYLLKNHFNGLMIEGASVNFL